MLLADSVKSAIVRTPIKAPGITHRIAQKKNATSTANGEDFESLTGSLALGTSPLRQQRPNDWPALRGLRRQVARDKLSDAHVHLASRGASIWGESRGIHAPPAAFSSERSSLQPP